MISTIVVINADEKEEKEEEDDDDDDDDDDDGVDLNWLLLLTVAFLIDFGDSSHYSTMLKLACYMCGYICVLSPPSLIPKCCRVIFD